MAEQTAKKALRVQMPAELDVKEKAEDGRAPMVGAAAAGEERMPTLVPVMAVGMSHVPGGVVLVDKDTVVYPVGRSIAMYSASNVHRLRVSEQLRSVRGISAIALSPNKKFLAAAESMADGYMPQVTVFDAATLERLATVSGPHISNAFVSVSFSSDGSMLLAAGTDDSHAMSIFHLWEWRTSPQPKCSGIHDARDPVLSVLLDPRFDNNVLVMCAHDVGLWRQGSNGFKRHPVQGLDLPAGACFVDLSILPDGRFLLATSARQVLVVDRAHAVLAVTVDRPISCLLGLPDGCFAVATAKGDLQLYRREHKDDPDKYAIFYESRVPESALSISLDSHIRSLSCDLEGDTLACATAGGGPTYVFKLGYAKALSLSPDTGSDLWEVLLPGNHEQAIVSADVAYKRDFFATASRDLTVRLWQTCPLRLVLTHMCHHSPQALSIDPYGRELVVAYVDGVRCYSIVEGMLLEGEELMHEFGPPSGAAAAAAAAAAAVAGGANGSGGGAGPAAGAAPGAAQAATNPDPGAAGGAGPRPPRKGARPLDHCSLVKYSPTGALIALAAGPGGRHVYIYSTLTKRQLAVLAGHFESVADLTWSDDGAYLASCGEGAVLTWAMDGFQKVQENTSKLYLNDSVTATPDFRTLVVGDTTQGLRIMETSRAPPPSWAAPDKVAESLAAAAAAAAAAGGGGGGAAAGGGGGWAAASGKAAGKAGVAGARAGAAAGVAAEEVPGSPFRVPGKASVVPIGAEPPAGSKTNKLQAVGRMQTMMQGALTDLTALPGAGAGPADRSGVPELRVRSNFQTIIQPVRGGLAVARCASAPGYGGGYQAVLGTGVLGRLRCCPLPPRSNDDFTEYFLHATDVTQVVAHRDGRLIFSTDSSGAWVMSLLLPPNYTDNHHGSRHGHGALAAAGADAPGGHDAPSSPGPRSPTPPRTSLAGTALALRLSMAGNAVQSLVTSHMTYNDRTVAAHRVLRNLVGYSVGAAGHGKAGGKEEAAAGAASGGRDGSQMVISVREVDMHLLQDNVRELKDRLAKAATEAEYKMYEREQGVRRELEGELSRLRAELDATRGELGAARAAMAEEGNAADRAKSNMAKDFERALREQQDLFEKKLAAEIARTDAAEREMQRLRAKFGRKLWQLDEEHAASVQQATEKQVELAATVEHTRREAHKAVAAAQAQTETELRIDGELNEEELQRAADAAQKQIEEKEEAYLKLLAKHTLQSGLAAKTTQENEKLRGEADTLRKENTRLAEQVVALMEELEAMQAAWADRDVRQRQQDAQMKDMAFQLQQAQLFTALATTRIKELNGELEPVKGARDEALGSVAQMESVAQRQLERQAKVLADNTTLQARLDATQEEIKKLQLACQQREAYFKNFTSQLFRVIQDVPQHQWSTLFGRLIEDYHRGRDKASWAAYLESDHGAAAHPPSMSNGGDGRAVGDRAAPTATTAAEYQEKMTELHAQLMHTERMLALVTDTKDKADRARKAVVAKLMNDNMMVVQELNDVKRDLRAARELAEKRAIELADLRMSLAVAGAPLPAIASTAVSLSGASGTGGGGGAAAGAAAAGAAGGDGNGTLPKGHAGRAMARLPSRFGDTGKAGAGAAGVGNAWGQEERPYTQQRDRGREQQQQAPIVVTGDMPQGGWWLGDNSPFELPSTLDHVASSTLRKSAVGGGHHGLSNGIRGSHEEGGGGGQDRPGTAAATAMGGAGGSMLGRRPATSMSSLGTGGGGSGRFAGARGAFVSSSMQFAGTGGAGGGGPGGVGLGGGRRAEGHGGGHSLVAAAVSGAALQAYQQRQRQQQEGQQGQEAGAREGEEGGVQLRPGSAASGSAATSQQQQDPADGTGSALPGRSRSNPGEQNAPGTGTGAPTSPSPPKPESPSRRVVSAGAIAHSPGSGGSGSGAARGAFPRSGSLPPTVLPLGAGLGGGGGGGAAFAGGHAAVASFGLQGSVRPSTPSKVTTMGAGFRSFVPNPHHGGHHGPGGGTSRGSSR